MLLLLAGLSFPRGPQFLTELLPPTRDASLPVILYNARVSAADLAPSIFAALNLGG